MFTRVAIIHDWLESKAGAEQVLEQLLQLYPQADLFCLVDFLPANNRAWLGEGRKVTPSFVQKLPLARKYFRHYLPLFPLAMRSHNLRGYEVVISSSHCMAKNVRIPKGVPHVCYCHSPIRYAWDMLAEYAAKHGIKNPLKVWLLRGLMAYLRWEDKRGSHGVTQFVANSSFIAARIQRCYGRESVVIHPPVAIEAFTPGKAKREDFYVAFSRLVPYKMNAMIARAFAAMPQKRLVVIGEGPERAEIEALATQHPNIRYLGYQPRDVLIDHLQRAKAYVFAALEDFGIAPVEAMACGTPVIAYGQGGVLDSVVGLNDPAGRAPTGVFYPKQTAAAVQAGVAEFETNHHAISAKACRAQAEGFGVAMFRAKFLAAVKQAS